MLIALIREEACVGCTKCISACPVDAIVGAAKFMHTVLTDECIGCGLCVSPCPMDCIEMQESAILDGSLEKAKRAEKAKARYQARQKRLLLEELPKLLPPKTPGEKIKIQQEIQEAIGRVQAKRNLYEYPTML